MSRKLKLISPEIGNLLINQLVHELQNHYLYNNFANYFSLEGVVDLEEYWKKRAAEEKAHHDWILNYLSEADCRVVYPVIPEDKAGVVTSGIYPFVAAVDREIETTQLIYKIYEQAISEKDYMTASWLFEKLIKEQIEEENTSRMALVIMKSGADPFVIAKKVLDLLN